MSCFPVCFACCMSCVWYLRLAAGGMLASHLPGLVVTRWLRVAVPNVQLDEWTETFEADEERRKQAAAAAAAGDGWTVVSRKGVQLPRLAFNVAAGVRRARVVRPASCAVAVGKRG